MTAMRNEQCCWHINRKSQVMPKISFVSPQAESIPGNCNEMKACFQTAPLIGPARLGGVPHVHGLKTSSSEAKRRNDASALPIEQLQKILASFYILLVHLRLISIGTVARRAQANKSQTASISKLLSSKSSERAIFCPRLFDRDSTHCPRSVLTRSRNSPKPTSGRRGEGPCRVQESTH